MGTGQPILASDVFASEGEIVIWYSDYPCHVRLLSAQDSSDRVSQPEALATMSRSPYTIENSVRALEKFYANTLRD